MSIFDKLKGNKDPAKQKIKKTDLDQNVNMLKESVLVLYQDITDLNKRLHDQKRETEEEKKQYEEIRKELTEKLELVSSFNKELDQVVSTRKRLRESGPVEIILKWGSLGLAGLMALFGIAADRESPKALKIIAYVNRLLPGQKG